MEPKKKKMPKLNLKLVWWVSLILYIAFVLSAVAIFVFDTEIAAIVLTAIVFMVVIFNKTFWRCPHCEKSLGRFGRKKQCPFCGEEVNM